MAFPDKSILFDADLAELARFARALAHPARMQIVRVLAERGTCICGEVVDELPLSQASVSRHLKVLKEAGLVRGEIDGPRSCYCLDPESIARLRMGMLDFFESIPTGTDETCC